ncbi:hypothetical protein [Methylosinus sp. Sm6]|uniref:hypothetical protein n=1 Tax=Methylosinus sp. Sm6 TaxID=2866948 RepID=UPI001C9974B8|nr:hypothetical protein [Methylosinus sp. Sm6]MBY6243981.1 hypothetical protein [Methylosinus sp. Sm6]
MFQLYAVDRAGVGAFIRDFVRSVSGAAGDERAFVTEKPRETPAAAHVEPPVAEPQPDLPRRGGRLIDLERRAKFARFDATR